ncbi:TPA: phage portal protein, partial [Streptococcus agalactiae]
MFRLDSDVIVSGELINKLIEKHTVKREVRLQKYYDGEHDVLNRKFADDTKPNNKIVTNFCQYITNVSVGYFMGKPISYSCHDKVYMEQLQEIFDLNDEQQVNA